MSAKPRRGSVLVLVLAVLVLIFVIGATLLTVSQLSRTSAESSNNARQMRSACDAAIDHARLLLRADVVGRDGIPYNGQ